MIDLQLEAMLKAGIVAGVPDLADLPPPVAREVYRQICTAADRPPADVQVHEPAAPVPVRVYSPKAPGPHALVVYYHGGGCVLGDVAAYDGVARQLCADSGAVVVSVDYRLAPEHPFPAPTEDAWSALCWLLADVDPAAIAFAGDSAGGGLTVTTSLAARDAGLPLPAAIVAFSPGFDQTRTGASMDTKAGLDPIFTRESLGHLSAHYLAGQHPNQPLLSPALRADLTGFPPTLLQAGTNEVLLDDSTRFAARARDAGADVILDITADVPHVFQLYAGVLDEADEALDRAALFLTQKVRP